MMSRSPSQVPLITLWYKPRQTLQGLKASGGGMGGAHLIAALFGLVQAYSVYRADPAAGALVLLAGPVLALGLLYLFAWLLRNFGRWFGAQAEPATLRLALGWGLLPWLLAFFLLATLTRGVADPAELAGMYPLFFAFFIYGYAVLLLTLQAALEISFIKTFLCLAVTFMVSLFPLTLLAQLLLGPPPAV